MSAARCVLEVRDSHGEIVTRVRIESLPVTIGRAYGCDVIVDDPYLDPTHIRIVEDGAALVAEDAGSVNGLRANRSNERVARVVLERGTVLHAGRSTIRYLDPTEPAPAARRDRPAAWNAPLSQPWMLNSTALRVGTVVACLLLVALRKWESWFELSATSKTVGETLAVLLIMACWAGLWAGAARLARHPAMFSYHLAITSLATGALVILVYVDDWFTFLWPAGMTGGATFILLMVILIVAVYVQLGLATSLRRWWRWATSIAIPGAAIALILAVANDDKAKFSTKMEFDSQLKPMPARLVPAVSVNDLKTSMAKLKENADKEEKEGEGKN